MGLQPEIDRVQTDCGGRVNVVAVAVAVTQLLRRIRHSAEAHGAEAHGAEYSRLRDAGGSVTPAKGALP